MHKLLLAIRDRPVRYIAVLGVVGMTLGVAVAAVACCVAPGLPTEIRERIQGALADTVIDASSTDDNLGQGRGMKIIDEVAGDYVESTADTQHSSSEAKSSDDDSAGIDKWIRSPKARQIKRNLGID
jgi:ABC-type lipoprotein release transport system permease subunit